MEQVEKVVSRKGRRIMTVIQIFLWVFMLVSFVGVYTEDRGKGWYFFVWLISLLLLTASTIFL